MSNLFVPIQTAHLDWHQDVPFSLQYNDIYHSASSGIEQSRYVFLDGNNLVARWQNLSVEANEVFTIAETGFGTGLNFLLTWHLWEEYAPPNWRLHFISCEKNPLSLADLKKALNFWPQLLPYAEQLLKQYPILTPGYHHLQWAEGRVTLTLMLGDALECYEQLLICGEAQLERELRTSFVDAWYLDGFAPKKNHSMWSEALIKTIAMLSNKGTTLATYTAAAVVKENLKHCGFIIEKKKGFGPKRHMLSAYFQALPDLGKTKRHTPWHIHHIAAHRDKSAVIVGAGLAGCFMAHSLAKRGWQVTILEALNGIGKGASGNQQAVLFPKLSAYQSPLTEFMLAAFLYAVQVYQPLLKNTGIGELKGSLLLAHNAKEQIAQASLKNWLAHYPELGQLLNAEVVSELAGLRLNESGLFIPMSGWIDSPALCQHLITNEKVSLITGKAIEQLSFEQRWVVNGLETDVLILANGYKLNSYKETQYLPIKPIRGQMTAIAHTERSKALKIPLCADGHVLPVRDHMHLIGATYELNTSEAEIKEQDDLLNFKKLNHLAPDVPWSYEVLSRWAGVRATTTDYLPVVGPVACESLFLERYSGLESNAKRWIPEAGPYYPGLYACAGFGSRGLTTIPLATEWLASLINHEMGVLPRRLQQALSPARFLRKKIIYKK